MDHFKPHFFSVSDVSEQHRGHQNFKENVESHFEIIIVSEKFDNRNKIIVETYQTFSIDKKVENHDYLVFTSPSNVEAFLLSNKFNNQKIISIGPSTTKALKNAGIINVLESFKSSELALADAVFSLI